MGSKNNLLNRFDHWLHTAPPVRSPAQTLPRTSRETQTRSGCTGHHRRPPFYLRWWLDAHRD